MTKAMVVFQYLPDSETLDNPNSRMNLQRGGAGDTHHPIFQGFPNPFYIV